MSQKLPDPEIQAIFFKAEEIAREPEHRDFAALLEVSVPTLLRARGALWLNPKTAPKLAKASHNPAFLHIAYTLAAYIYEQQPKPASGPVEGSSEWKFDLSQGIVSR